MVIQWRSERKISSSAKLLIIDCDGTLTNETHWLLEDYLSKVQNFVPHCLHKCLNPLIMGRKPNTEIIKWLVVQSKCPDCQIIVLTSRLFYLIDMTLVWFKEYKVPYDTIVCRERSEKPIDFKMNFIETNRSIIKTIVDNDRRVLRGARDMPNCNFELLHPNDIRFMS